MITSEKLKLYAVDLLFLLFGSKERQREKIRSAPFPNDWEEIIRTNFPLYLKLSNDEQERLQKHIQVFLSEKSFEGCNGLKITDEIRVTIAAQACLLILNHKHPRYYPRVNSILVYPAAFKAPVDRITEAGTLAESKETISGQAWKRDLLILSWNDVLQGSLDKDDGHNVVFHEFAHQLDARDGDYDGVPVLPLKSMYEPWERVLSKEYERLVRDTDKGKNTFLNEYGATNRAEFFAVSTEHFFEQPRDFKKKHRDLYELLKVFYQQDPGLRLSASHTSKRKIKDSFSLPAYLDANPKELKKKQLSPLEKELRSQFITLCVVCLFFGSIALINPALLARAVFFVLLLCAVGWLLSQSVVLVCDLITKKHRQILRNLKQLEINLVEGDLDSGIAEKFYNNVITKLPDLGFEQFLQFNDSNLRQPTGIDYETVFRSEDKRIVISFAHRITKWRDLIPFLGRKEDYLYFFTMFSDGSDLTSTTSPRLTQEDYPEKMRIVNLDQELSLDDCYASHKAEVERLEATHDIRVKRFMRQSTFLKFLRKRAKNLAKFHEGFLDSNQ